MELRRRLRARDMPDACTDKGDETNNNLDPPVVSLPMAPEHREEENMEIDAISKKPETSFLQNEKASQQKSVENTLSFDPQLLLKSLYEMTKFMTAQNAKISAS
ncbi:hypothetical protein FSP39_003281 [Pinctada imbricata]|uniref:Uncharacterized protein n=1 Tax=Pinctada imbricata TaxID=66713 RepID=A0AA88YKX3_PINIB|nr:hypothetical protein FSP39_003281 [Pinctada imbricata]